MNVVASGRRGKATITKGHGQLRGRHCVKVKLAKPHKTPRRGHIRGMKPAPVEFHGCFTSKSAAVTRARKAVTKQRTRRKGRK